MPVDAAIYNALGTKPMSVADYDEQSQRTQQNALNIQRSKQQLNAYTQDQAEKASLRNYLAGNPDLSTAQGVNGGYSAAPTQFGPIYKAYQDSVTSAALAAKDKAQAGNFTADAAKTTQQTHFDLLQHGIQALTAASTPDAAKQAVIDGVSKGYWSMQDAQQKVAQIPADPAAYQDWRIQQLKTILPAADLLKANMPNLSTHNTGASTVTLASDPLTGKTAPVSTIQNTVSPDTAATTATTRRGQDIAAETARTGQNIEVVKADPFGTLGLNKTAPAGAAAASTLSGEDYLKTLPPAVANQVKMLSEGRMPITAQSARSPQMMQLLAMASQYEPGTDATAYVQRAQTIKDFAPGGKDGQAITNLNTAIHHAGQLSDAIDNLNNSNFLPGVTNPVENVVGQKLLGQTAQGVYKQKADALASELRKVYAGGGGGSLSELNEWQKSFDGNASKDQQKAYLQSGMELLTGALQAKKDAYDRGMGSRAQFGQFITPESTRVLTKLAPSFASQIGNSSGAPATPQTSNQPTVSNW